MPGEEVLTENPKFTDAVYRIAYDALAIMRERGINLNSSVERSFMDNFPNHIISALRGIKYDQKVQNTLYREDVLDDMDNFLAGSNKLPYFFDKEMIAHAMTTVVFDYRREGLTSAENDLRAMLADVQHGLDVKYDDRRPELLTTENPVYLSKKSGGAKSEPYVFGIFGQSAQADLWGMSAPNDYLPNGAPAKVADSFDAFIASKMPYKNTINNPEVNAEYKEYINLFSINGKPMNYHKTGDKQRDADSLDKAKIAILTAIKDGKNVEFTNFTLDGKVCKAEQIPISHISNARNIKPHVAGNQDIRAKKAAEKITKNIKKNEEKAHKAFQETLKKEEAARRKNIVDGYKSRINAARDRQTKNVLKAELKQEERRFKRIDAEQKNRHKAAERARKDAEKRAARELKERLNREKAEQKARERREREEAKRIERELKNARKRGDMATVNLIEQQITEKQMREQPPQAANPNRQKLSEDKKSFLREQTSTKGGVKKPEDASKGQEAKKEEDMTKQERKEEEMRRLLF
ncbi:MAG: hypothetical protein LUI60_04545 [Clostridia bacterium]|nr:hypothetical protein [Clostridia bacterium]